MHKPPLKQIDGNRLKVALIFALTYNLLFNSSIFIFKFNYYSADIFRGSLELTKDFIYINFFLFIIFLGLNINRFLSVVITFLLFISGAIVSYYLYFLGITPTQEMIYSVFNTHPTEALELISTKLLLWLFLVVLVWWYLIKKTSSITIKTKQDIILGAICLLIFFASIISPRYKILNSYFPLQYLHNTYKYVLKNFEHKFKENIADKFEFIDESHNNIIGILVIGESARYDHLNINGYQRNTTPYLSSLKNVYSYKAESCSTYTYLSVPCMLSRQSAMDVDKIDAETSFLSVLSKLKFNTNWIGTQSLMRYSGNSDLRTIYDEVKFAIVPGGSALYKLNDLDEVMLPYIQKMLETGGKQFLVIHLSGSHWNYDSRYAKEFALFRPTCNNSPIKVDPSSCGLEKLINSYDNSILYTDFILYKIIEQLKDKNAFLLYVSDHAESLGEEGRYGHGGDFIPEQTTIPLIVWYSDIFDKKEPNINKALSSHLNEQISHDHVFHSILDCLGIKSTVINQNQSLCKVRNE